MKIPKYIKRNNRIYEYVKTYPNFCLYEDEQTKVKRCFSKFDLGLITEQEKVVKLHNTNPRFF